MMISELCLALFLSQLPETTSPWPKDQPLLGHRGARARAPENTLASFKLAMDSGADGVEFDVFLSKDKIPFVIHDDTLERTTDGKGIAWKKTIEELRGFNAAKGWPDLEGITIPTLAETLDAMPDNSVVNIELKGEGLYSKEEFADVVLQVIAGSRERLFIIVSSFDADLLAIMRSKDPDLFIGQLFDEKSWKFISSLTKMKSIRPNSINVSPRLGTPWIVKLAHSKGLRAMIWTVNDQDFAKHLFASGVDGIFSDMPQGFRWTDSKH